MTQYHEIIFCANKKAEDGWFSPAVIKTAFLQISPVGLLPFGNHCCFLPTHSPSIKIPQIQFFVKFSDLSTIFYDCYKIVEC